MSLWDSTESAFGVLWPNRIVERATAKASRPRRQTSMPTGAAFTASVVGACSGNAENGLSPNGSENCGIHLDGADDEGGVRSMRRRGG